MFIIYVLLFTHSKKKTKQKETFLIITRLIWDC